MSDTLVTLIESLPPRDPDNDRTVLVFVIDTNSGVNPDIEAVGPAVATALDNAGVDVDTEVNYLAYREDVEESSEGWRPGSSLTEP